MIIRWPQQYNRDWGNLGWNESVKLIDQLEAHFSIQLLDLRSGDRLTHHEIDRVNITVVVPIETTRRQATTPFPGSGDAAQCRQEGTNRSLRRPFVFTGPFAFPAQSSGPDFVPFRPVPPALRRPGLNYSNFRITLKFHHS
jgi:hypothetical protein